HPAAIPRPAETNRTPIALRSRPGPLDSFSHRGRPSPAARCSASRCSFASSSARYQFTTHLLVVSNHQGPYTGVGNRSSLFTSFFDTKPAGQGLRQAGRCARHTRVWTAEVAATKAALALLWT